MSLQADTDWRYLKTALGVACYVKKYPGAREHAAVYSSHFLACLTLLQALR